MLKSIAFQCNPHPKGNDNQTTYIGFKGIIQSILAQNENGE